MPRALVTLALLACAAVLPGCLQRTIKITSEPPGAMVWVNEVEVGRTPTEVDFTYFGTYDVRVRREGYEPVIDKRKTPVPLYERPGIDLLAEALPVRIETVVPWHFVLEPVAEAGPDLRAAERAVIQRANDLRAAIAPDEPAPEPVEPAAP